MFDNRYAGIGSIGTKDGKRRQVLDHRMAEDETPGRSTVCRPVPGESATETA
jgi:hypothetical protein